MCFQEDPVGAGGNPCFSQGFDELRLSAGGACRPVGNLQGMGDIQDDRDAERLHHRDPPEIDHQVVETESAATLCQHYLVIARLTDLFYSKLHRFGRDKLSFFDVHRLARPGSCDQQIGLAAKEGGDLKNINIFCRPDGIGFGMDIGQCGNIELLSDLPDDAERFDVANPLEGIEP